MAKSKKSLKYDFSFANWGDAMEQWLKGVKKHYSVLFPDVSKQAHVLAGVKVKPTEADDESSSSESGSDSSGRDLNSNYEGFGNGSNNNHQYDADGDNNEVGGGQGTASDCYKLHLLSELFL